MEHYFIAKEHKEEDFFEFTAYVLDNTYKIKSCDSVFSKNEVDYGTNLLIKTFYKDKQEETDKKAVLDVGCGYGIIGMSIAGAFKNYSVTMCDINSVAVELSRHNVLANHIKNVENIIESDGYSKINQTFDYILTNPPIKAGKQNLMKILEGAFEYLNENGELWFVIKKKHGEDSVKKALQIVFSSVEVIKRDAGYYILKAVK